MSLKTALKEDEFSSFLNDAGWQDSNITPLSADMGLRRYYLLEKGPQKALLMDMSRAGILETGLGAYIKIDEYLRSININAPEIYHSDLNTGLAVIEYFGDQSFGDALHSGADKEQLYSMGTDILIQIRQSSSPPNDLNLPPYKNTLIWDRLPQFVDYYMPFDSGMVISDKTHQEYQAVWKQIENSLPKPINTICLADYHLENLMIREGQDPLYGIIDFQDAFWGPCAYDLLNLLHDARVTVPGDLIAAMKDKYCADMNAEERENFEAWYCILSAQFHCRVIGLFLKFADEGRGEQFLPHIPRLQCYLKENLENPLLSPLKEFLENHSITLEKQIGA
ncbi:MAG: phosphotransferase [Pseudomonadota bacterium]